MMTPKRIVLSYDSEEKSFIFIYRNKMIPKYSELFNEIVKDLNDEILMRTVPVTKLVREFVVKIDVDNDSIKKSLKKSKDGMVGFTSLALDPEDAQELQDKFEEIQILLNRFEWAVLQEETKNLEFIPLRGYPESDLISDIKDAYENKRDFCVIDDFDGYKDLNQTMTLKQVVFKYGSDMYNNILLASMSGDIDEIRKLTEKSLKEKSYA